MLLAELRAEVCHLHALLPANNLVAWTSGNISGRDPTSGLIVIKPSGLKYDQLTPENMVVVDDNGQVVEGQLTPSSDTLSHCYIYRQRSDVGGVVHTHSRYATAFAAVGQSIPCVLTAMGDEVPGTNPLRRFRPHRRRRNRARSDTHPGRIAQPRRASAKSRRLYYRQKCGSSGQSGSNDRGRCRHRLACSPARKPIFSCARRCR